MRTVGVKSAYCARLLRRPDPDRLDVGELLDPVFGELAPVARLLDPAEWKAPVRGDHTVDEHQAGRDALGKLCASRDVGGPDARAQTEIGIVGHTERLFLIADADHRRDGPECLLVVNRHARPDAHEHGRLEVVPVAVDALPTDQRPRAELYRLRHLALQIGDEVLAREWADLHTTILWVADLERANGVGEV